MFASGPWQAKQPCDMMGRICSLKSIFPVMGFRPAVSLASRAATSEGLGAAALESFEATALLQPLNNAKVSKHDATVRPASTGRKARLLAGTTRFGCSFTVLPLCRSAMAHKAHLRRKKPMKREFTLYIMEVSRSDC